MGEFGKHVRDYQCAFPERNYSIYTTRYSFLDRNYDGSIFYFADDLGLISAFILGPNFEDKNNNFSLRKDKDIFFGHELGINEKNTNTFGCFQDYEKGSNNPVKKVDLKMLYSDFLPLPSDKWSRVNNYKVSVHDSILIRGSESNNSLILQSDKRTFFLPFDELIFPVVGEQGRLRVSAHPNENYFEIWISRVTRIRKKEITEKWNGKVSYDKFELIEFDFLTREYYDTW